MGNAEGFSSPYSVGLYVHTEIKEGRWQRLTANPEYFAAVDLTKSSTTTSPFRHVYTVVLNDCIPTNCLLAMVFPHHPKMHSRVLRSNECSSLVQLGREINARIRKSNPETLQIACGERLFQFTGIRGNIYVIWCKRVTQHSINEQRSLVGEMIPALIELDGYGRGLSMVLLDPKQPVEKIQSLPLAGLRVFTPFRVLLFSCERRQEKAAAPIRTHIEAETICKATETILDRTVRVPDLIPREMTDSDGELVVEGDELEFIRPSPRFALE